MSRQYHILNGDALRQQFPSAIEGEIIVARECLVDGDIEGENLEELFHSRAQFIASSYSGYTEADYYRKTVPEFQKIQEIGEGAMINLWFEDDLFCQVNLWFVAHLLLEYAPNSTVYLVRPKLHTHYGFGGFDKAGLISLYKEKTLLTEIERLAKLWKAYQNQHIEGLLDIAKALEEIYPFILPAVQAHIDRVTIERPSQSLKMIMEELQTENFGTVFKEFNQRESIYGFGDLQVKRLFDDIMESRG